MIAAEVVTSRTTDLSQELVISSWQFQIRVVFFTAKLDVRGSPRALAPQERKPIPIYLPIHANNGGRAQHFQTEIRSEEHTSELQSHSDLVCRLLLEKKKQPTSKLPNPEQHSPP